MRIKKEFGTEIKYHFVLLQIMKLILFLNHVIFHVQ